VREQRDVFLRHADLSGVGDERYFERRQAHDLLQGTGEVPFLDLEWR
jgi:hypothetical protein